MTRRVDGSGQDPHHSRSRRRAYQASLRVAGQHGSGDVRQAQPTCLGVIDLIIGCGDLDCDDLAFIADSVDAPLVYVYGNHDTEDRWRSCGHLCGCDRVDRGDAAGRTRNRRSHMARQPRKAGRAQRAEAWSQVLSLATRRLGRPYPMVVMSHVPPLGAGDVPTDAYHRGFKGYRWLLEREQPLLWLHGRTIGAVNMALVERPSSTSPAGSRGAEPTRYKAGAPEGREQGRHSRQR